MDTNTATVTTNAPEIAPEAAAPSLAPTAKVVAKAAPVIFTPVAVVITARPRAVAIQAIRELKPLGNPRVEVLEAARRLALDLAETFPAADALETKIEITGATGHQVLVQVIPSTWQ